MLFALLLITAPTTKVFTAAPEGFLVNATLISGKKDAILVDGMFRLDDAKKLAADIAATKKNLTTIYVTHAHPDHYFGLEALKEKFPNAKIVALPSTVEEIRKTWKAKLDQWKPMYKESLTNAPIVPEPLEGTTLTLEGEKLEIHSAQGDDAHNSFIWIASTKTLIAGDIVFDGVFLWTAETTPADRKTWAGSLDALAAKKPALVVPGHQKPQQKPGATNLAFDKEYLATFDAALATAKNPEELLALVKAKYPDLALDVILKIGAEAALKSK